MPNEVFILRHGREHFDFLPRTYVLPEDTEALKDVMRNSDRSFFMIFLPSTSLKSVLCTCGTFKELLYKKFLISNHVSGKWLYQPPSIHLPAELRQMCMQKKELTKAYLKNSLPF